MNKRDLILIILAIVSAIIGTIILTAGFLRFSILNSYYIEELCHIHANKINTINGSCAGNVCQNVAYEGLTELHYLARNSTEILQWIVVILTQDKNEAINYMNVNFKVNRTIICYVDTSNDIIFKLYDQILPLSFGIAMFGFAIIMLITLLVLGLIKYNKRISYTDLDKVNVDQDL